MCWLCDTSGKIQSAGSEKEDESGGGKMKAAFVCARGEAEVEVTAVQRAGVRQ